MDSYRVIEVFFSDSLEDGYCKPLSDFSSMRTQEVEAYNPIVVSFVDDHLGIAILRATMVQVPFKRFINATICDNVLISKGLSGIFLTIATTAILDRSENSGRNVLIAH